MRPLANFLFVVFLLLAGVSTSFGQIQLLPPTVNPAVIHQSKQLDKQRTALLESLDFRERAEPMLRGPLDCATPDPSIRYAVSGGDPLVINPDTTFNGGGLFEILPCHQFGTLSNATDTTVGQLYLANTGIDLAFDTVCVRYCSPDGSYCDTLRYAILVKRKGLVSDVQNIVLATSASATVSLDTTSLPYEFECDSKEQFNAQLGELTFSDNFEMLYESSRFAGPDTVWYIYCDVNTICDSIIIAVQVIGDTIDLPLLDEFSFAGPYPNPTLWLDDNVFIGNTYAYAPVGQGAATLDGISKTGRPHGTQIGLTDVLTSAYLDLSSLPANAYFSFYRQGGGYCDPVEANDSLILQFKFANGKWNTIDTFRGVNVNAGYEPTWVYESYIIQDPSYLYNGFQFRFLAYGDQSGLTDPWHIDYVRLATTQQASKNFGDVAFSSNPSSILQRYTSMPWKQFSGFESLELADSLDVGLFNHFPAEISITDSRAALEEVTTSTTMFDPPFVLVTGNFPTEATDVRRPIADYLTYEGLMGSAFAADAGPLDFELTYTLTNNSQEAVQGYYQNDTARTITHFGDLMAYDDGSAERSIIADAAGSQIALRYSLNVPDTLRAIQFMFPRINNSVADQNFELKIWIATLDGSPAYQRTVLPYYPDAYFDTLQGFTTYVLDTALFIDTGYLFVGWQQLSNASNSIPVGFDMNNADASQYMFFYDPQSAQWFPLAGDPNIKGVAMIRPVFGYVQCTPCVLETDESLRQEPAFSLFPNPANALIQVKTEMAYTHVRVADALGRVWIDGDFESTIPISALPAGMYLMTLFTADQQPQSRSFIVVR
jgi:Secretion system C-terminal sorting domain